MIKAVFCDMDETLLVNWHVPEINRKEIAKIREQGTFFIPCSGRPPFMMEEILQELNLYDCPNEYYICLNGGMLLEAKNNRVLYYNGLSFEETAELLELAEQNGICMMIVTDKGFHIFHPLASEVDRKTRQQTVFTLYENYDMRSVDALREESIGKVMFVSDEGVEGFKVLSKSFPEKIQENYEITFSSGRFMEFNKKGVSKGNGLQHLAEYLHISIEDTLAIGDSLNDISMIQRAGIGTCVLSADEDLKAVADYTSERDYMEGAVAEILEHFVERR